MAESYIIVPPDGTGKKVRTTQANVGGVDIEEQVIQLANTSNAVISPAKEDGNLQDLARILRMIANTPIMRAAIDSTEQLRVVQASAIPAGTNAIGVVYTENRLLATPYTDTTTNLSANAVYTGTSRDCQISSSSPYPYYGVITAFSTSDQSGSLFLQESPDNSTWVTVKSVATSPVIDTDGSTTKNIATITHNVTLRYVRIVYRNGASVQGTFRLSSRISSYAGGA